MANREKIKVFLSDLKNDVVSQKALFESMSFWLQGSDQFDICFLGTKEQISAAKLVMLETKKFQDVLFCKDATLKEVFENLSSKHSAANSFKEVFRISWIF